MGIFPRRGIEERRFVLGGDLGENLGLQKGLGAICASRGDLEEKICARIESLRRKRICARQVIFFGVREICAKRGDIFILGGGIS